MQYLFVILILLASYVVASAQSTSQTPQTCPTLTAVISPSYAKVGTVLTAKALITGADIKKLKFTWFIKGGKILKGQGKPEIKVKQTSENAGDSLVVVVEIINLPAGCHNAASATIEVPQKTSPKI
jgi:hypothetical protein